MPGGGQQAWGLLVLQQGQTPQGSPSEGKSLLTVGRSLDMMNFKIHISDKNDAPRKATEPVGKAICSIFLLQKRDFRPSLS